MHSPLVLFCGYDPLPLRASLTCQVGARPLEAATPSLLTSPCYPLDFPTSRHGKMFQTLSTLSLPKPYDQLFFQRTLLPFSGGWHLEAKTQLLRVLAAVGGVSPLKAFPWGELGVIWTPVQTCIHVYSLMRPHG